MRHIERHTFVLAYDKEKVNIKALYDELSQFSIAWPNAMISNHILEGEVQVAYEGFSLGRELAESAILDFRDNVSRHEWWEEV